MDRWVATCAWCLACGLGCGPGGAASESGETDGSTDGGSATGIDLTNAGLELCRSALDPDIYETPAWSPAPIVGTPECPAVDGPVQLEMSTVELDGQVTFDGAVSPPNIWLRGRGDEGDAAVPYAEDGSFSVTVAPGRYDVMARVRGDWHARDLVVVEDVSLDQPTTVQVDVPPPVQLHGSMTLDGAPTVEPFGHILVRFSGDGFVDFSGPLPSIQMDEGTYSVLVPPGSYEFVYVYCDPTQPYRTGPPDHFAAGRDGGGARQDRADAVGLMSELADPPPPVPTVLPPNPCYDPAAPDFEGTPASPRGAMAIETDVEVTADLELDLEVRTVRLSGSIEGDGIEPESLHSVLFSGYGLLWLDGPSFDTRVVVGTYSLYGDSDAPAFEDSLVLDVDTEVQRTLHAWSLDLPLAEDPSLVEVVEAAGVDLDLEALVVPVDTLFGSPRERLPLSGPLTVYDTGPYAVLHQQGLCWLDYEGKGFLGWKTVDDQARFDGPSEITLSLDPVARVAVEYEDLAGPEWSGFGLFGTQDDLPASAVFRVEAPAFEAHGIWPVGTYRIKGDVVDVVDGTTIRVVEESKPLELELVIDGRPVPAVDYVGVSANDEELAITNSATYRPEWEAQGDRLPPGQYRLTYNADSDRNASLPGNLGFDLGCVTIED